MDSDEIPDAGSDQSEESEVKESLVKTRHTLVNVADAQPIVPVDSDSEDEEEDNAPLIRPLYMNNVPSFKGMSRNEQPITITLFDDSA